MTTLGVPFGAASPTSVRVDLPIHAFVVEAVAKPPVVLYVKPVQGGESLASDGGRLRRYVNIILHHSQRRMAQIMFKEKDVPSIEQEHRGIAVS